MNKREAGDGPIKIRFHVVHCGQYYIRSTMVHYIAIMNRNYPSVLVSEATTLQTEPQPLPIRCTQRDETHKERILEQFLPISKQTPKPLTSIKCKDV